MSWIAFFVGILAGMIIITYIYSMMIDSKVDKILKLLEKEK